jgi:hypothetical protein
MAPPMGAAALALSRVLSFFVVNLILPGDPETVEIATASGTWTLARFAEYDKSKAAIANGQ